MLDLILDSLTQLKILEMQSDSIHPIDSITPFEKENLVDRITMADDLCGGRKGSKRAQSLNDVAHAKALLSFVPGSKITYNPKTFEVDSKVRISGKFLRNTGQYFKSLENDDVGYITNLRDFGDSVLATVKWNRYSNIDGESHLSECNCYEDERPTCTVCNGSGKTFQRILTSNLELMK